MHTHMLHHWERGRLAGWVEAAETTPVIKSQNRFLGDDIPSDLDCGTVHCEGYATRGLGCIEGWRDLHGNRVYYRRWFFS